MALASGQCKKMHYQNQASLILLISDVFLILPRCRLQFTCQLNRTEITDYKNLKKWSPPQFFRGPQNGRGPAQRFVREKTGEKRFENQKPSLRYKRARYYHAHLGRFISRDPIGFVDGMSQYRGYFVPGSVDPSGLKIKKCKCSRVPWSSSTNRAGNPTNVRTSYVFTTGSCQSACCSGFKPGSRRRGGDRSCSGAAVASTTDETSVIGICAGNPICEKSIADLMNTVHRTRRTEGTDGEFCFQWLSRHRIGVVVNQVSQPLSSPEIAPSSFSKYHLIQDS